MTGLSRVLTISVATVILLSLSCGGDDGTNPGTTGPTGTLSGQVLAPTATANQPVVGAIVKVVGGPSAVADANGAFTMSVAAGVDLTVEVSGPHSADPTYPVVHSTYELVTSVADGEETQIFPTLVIGCSQILDISSGATFPLASCGGGGQASLVFEAGDLAKPDGTPFNGEVRVDMMVLDPATPSQIAAFSHPDESETDLGGVYGGMEVRLSEAANGNPLNVAAGQSVTVSMPLADLTGVNAADIKRQTFDTTLGMWVDESPGVVNTAGPDPYYEFEATHFSGLRASTGGGPAPRTCLTFCAELPGSQVCNYSGYSIEAFSNRRWFVLPAPTTCLDISQIPNLRLRLRYVAPWDGSVWEIDQVVYSGVPPLRECGNCLDLGQFDFEQYRVPASGNPIAQFTMDPTPAYVGEPVQFDATSSSDDDGIIVVDWDVDGDGNLERYGAIVEYTYDQPGTYDVRLRVIDSASQVATRTQQLQVIERNGGGNPRLTVAIEGQGSVISDPPGIACSPEGGTCSLEFPPGTTVVLTATPYPGFAFEAFLGCDSQTQTTCTVQMNADRTVTALFPAQ